MTTKSKSYNGRILSPKLRAGIVNIFFRKSNGQFRSINATTQEGMTGKVKNGRKRNSNICTVWDIDSAEWRSVRYDSIISIKGANNG
jgi:hypothetical protein